MWTVSSSQAPWPLPAWAHSCGSSRAHTSLPPVSSIDSAAGGRESGSAHSEPRRTSLHYEGSDERLCGTQRCVSTGNDENRQTTKPLVSGSALTGSRLQAGSPSQQGGRSDAGSAAL